VLLQVFLQSGILRCRTDCGARNINKATTRTCLSKRSVDRILTGRQRNDHIMKLALVTTFRDSAGLGIPLRFLQAFVLALAICGTANAELDLRNASIQQLDNGLTVILLEDRNFPVASVQMLYRVGARDEVTGKTGLAHFLEHMAFRASLNFPDTDLVSSIYAIGGEWHGYTWIDQTTYFATVPKEQLDLLLRVEADRMSRLVISKDDIAAERGAVLAEMHMYENDPTSMLFDAVIYTSFLAHPYRNNTIGWESDIENVQHEDALSFYRRHYHPANAVIAVVGDFTAEEISARIEELFGDFDKRAPTPMPHTIEPEQRGERRVQLSSHSDARQFVIAYRAPSVRSHDFAAFLVLQSLLGASSGVNFSQNDWGTDVAERAVLYGAAENLTTWYPPSAQDYVFVIGGTTSDGDAPQDVEDKLEQRLETVRRQLPSKEATSVAVSDVLEQLVFDLETTEDAAHQLAFFDGLHAIDTLLLLPDLVAAVTPADLQHVAAEYLRPEQRSIAWLVPQSGEAEPAASASINARPAAPGPVAQIDTVAVSAPVVQALPGGITAILQESDLSPSSFLRLVFPSGRIAGAGVRASSPVHGHSSLTYRFQPDQLTATVAESRDAISQMVDRTGVESEPSTDPETRLDEVFEEITAADKSSESGSIAPGLIVASGDLNTAETLALFEKHFADLAAVSSRKTERAKFVATDLTVSVGVPVAQSHLGYVVPAAGPNTSMADAQRLLLYILSHGYEGRLGKEAIAERGLAYYIDSRYRSDGHDGWITLSIGVDTHKATELHQLLRSELERLVTEPPGTTEVEEAKAHFVGRAQSSAQSNAELTATLARQWLWHGALTDADELRNRLASISQEDVLHAIPAFVEGTTILVTE